jgi:hypothetical protein
MSAMSSKDLTGFANLPGLYHFPNISRSAFHPNR